MEILLGFVGAIAILLFAVLFPYFIIRIVESEDIFYSIRPALTRRLLKKSGYRTLNPLVDDIYGIQATDWEYGHDGFREFIRHKPLPSQQQLFFQFQIPYSDGSGNYELTLHYKTRKLAVWIYRPNEGIKYMYSDSLKMDEEPFLGLRGIQLFQHLIELLEKRRELSRNEKEKERTNIENAESVKKGQFTAQLAKKDEAFLAFLEQFSNEKETKDGEFAVQLSPLGNTQFVMFYLQDIPFLNVKVENQVCTTKSMNEQDSRSTFFLRHLTLIEEACLKRFSGIEQIIPLKTFAIPFPSISEWLGRIDALLENLQKDRDWLSADEYHLVSSVYRDDLKNLLDTFQQLKEPQKEEKALVESLEFLHRSLLTLSEKVETNKKNALEKQKRLIRIREK